VGLCSCVHSKPPYTYLKRKEEDVLDKWVRHTLVFPTKHGRQRHTSPNLKWEKGNFRIPVRLWKRKHDYTHGKYSFPRTLPGKLAVADIEDNLKEQQVGKVAAR
jgi:hypothetical protein